MDVLTNIVYRLDWVGCTDYLVTRSDLHPNLVVPSWYIRNPWWEKRYPTKGVAVSDSSGGSPLGPAFPQTTVTYLSLWQSPCLSRALLTPHRCRLVVIYTFMSRLTKQSSIWPKAPAHLKNKTMHYGWPRALALLEHSNISSMTVAQIPMPLTGPDSELRENRK